MTVVITINSYNKCEYFYAFCNKGHAAWKGNQYESCHGELADTKKMEAGIEATDHDSNVHNGVKTAIVINE